MVLGSNGIYSKKNIYIYTLIFQFPVYVEPSSQLPIYQVTFEPWLYPTTSIFWRSTYQNKAFFQARQESIGFEVYMLYICVFITIYKNMYIYRIYIYISIHLYLFEKYSKKGGGSVSQLV